MAFKHGKNTAVLLGAVDLSPYLNSADLATEMAVADTTTYGATWRAGLPGHAGATVDVGGFYDPTELSLQAFMLAQLPGVLTYCPAGALAIGDRARLVEAYDLSYSESAPVGGIVAVAASFQAEATVGFGQVLHVLSADTDTTTGASKNDGAATSTGWTAHLHVEAVTDGSWVVKLEDSANNSDWADVTGGTFTAATDATAQRLRGATDTTTLRRYVRYVATRTGGADTDSITFLLAYSRN